MSLTSLLGTSAPYSLPSTLDLDKCYSMNDHFSTAMVAGPTGIPVTIQSETTTKKVSEWIASFSDREEAERLITLGNYPNDEYPSCAEILQTCHLKPSDPGHHAAYLSKMLKFHPDVSKQDYDVAHKASIVLGSIAIDSRHHCSGQNSWGCQQNNYDVTVHQELITPHWMYAKVMSAEAECFISIDDSISAKASLEACK